MTGAEFSNLFADEACFDRDPNRLVYRIRAVAGGEVFECPEDILHMANPVAEFKKLCPTFPIKAWRTCNEHTTAANCPTARDEQQCDAGLNDLLRQKIGGIAGATVLTPKPERSQIQFYEHAASLPERLVTTLETAAPLWCWLVALAWAAWMCVRGI